MEEMLRLSNLSINGSESEADSDDDNRSPSFQNHCHRFQNRLLALLQEAKDLKTHEAQFMRDKTLAFKNVDLHNSADSLQVEFQELRRTIELSSVGVDFSVPRCLELFGELNSVCGSISKSAEEAADKELTEKMPSLLVSENPLKEKFACVLCKKEFGVAEEVLMVPCSFHELFHSRCITTWLKTWNHCPSCHDTFPKKKPPSSAQP